MDYTYAHFNTSGGERETATAKFNIPRLGDDLQKIRDEAAAREIPVSDGETLNFLATLMAALSPKNILELGTATGLSAAVMQRASGAHITTIERDENFAAEAARNFKNLNICDKIDIICGDAGEVIKGLSGPFDFVFLDCAKVQYVKYLPEIIRLLKVGGTLVADDVLLFGYVTGERQTPKKRKMLVKHIEEYISAATNDSRLQTTILNIGNGIAMSVKL